MAITSLATVIVVAGLARDAVELAAEAVDDLPHGTVVEIDHAAPGRW